MKTDSGRGLVGMGEWRRAGLRLLGALSLLGMASAVSAATFNVEKRTPNGDGGLGPFDLVVTCQNGNTYNFTLNGGEASTFDYPDNTPIDCQIDETLRPAQNGQFAVSLHDTYSTDNGRIRANNSSNVSGETFYVVNDYTPSSPPVTINVVKETPNGDGGLGPFNIDITCKNGMNFNFSLNGGDSASFQYPGDTPIDCRVSETLTPAQDGLFKVKKGDDFGPSNGRMRAGNSNSVDGHTFTVTNIHVPPGVVDINVSKETPNGDNGLGPFNVAVDCTNGDSYLFELDGGDTETFQYEAGSAIDCRVSETLTAAQDGQFKIKLGDDYGPNNGRMRAGNSNSVDGRTFLVTNTYVPGGVVNIGVEKITPNGDGGLGPFDVFVNCANGDRYDFQMSGGETASFQYEAGSAIDCRIGETLTAAQDGVFKVKKGDDYGPDNGRMRAGNSNSVDGHTFTVTNIYTPTGVIDIHVEKSTPNGDGGRGPFDLSVSCANGQTFDFAEMDGGDTETFQYDANTPIDCRVSETLTALQDGFFKVRKGDDYGPDNGRMRASNSNNVASHTFHVVNTFVQQGVVDLNVVLGGDAALNVHGPFTIIVSCSNGDQYELAMWMGETETIQYERDAAIDCVSQVVLTPEQEQLLLVEISDTVGMAQDGRIVSTNSNLVDNATFSVLLSGVPRPVPALGGVALIMLMSLMGLVAMRWRNGMH